MTGLDFYVASTAPGKYWHVTAFKRPGLAGCIAAMEGSMGVTGLFTYAPFGGDRVEREPVKGNMTKTNINKALDQMQTRMEDIDKLVVQGEMWARV